MKVSRILLLLFIFLLALAIASCSEETPTDTAPNPSTDNASPTLDLTNPNSNNSNPSADLTLTPGAPGPNPADATPANTSGGEPAVTATLPKAAAAYCTNGGRVVVNGNEPVAARVNGEAIPLALYQRQVAQAQVALVSQGLDPNSPEGQDAIKGLQEQMLGLLIDNILIEQAARQEKVSVSDQDVNNRVQQIIDDAGGRDKFDEYLKSNQLTLDDLCTQIRSEAFGALMLNRVTAALPNKADQIHVAQIVLANKADADKVLALVKKGQNFAALAKQYSVDELTKDNGGDLGWLPKGVMAPEFDAAAFPLKPGQVSGVVQTQLGFHIIKVLEAQAGRPLSPDLLQNQKQMAFLAWLQARRDQAKIEKLVNP